MILNSDKINQSNTQCCYTPTKDCVISFWSSLNFLSLKFTPVSCIRNHAALRCGLRTVRVYKCCCVWDRGCRWTVSTSLDWWSWCWHRFAFDTRHDALFRQLARASTHFRIINPTTRLVSECDKNPDLTEERSLPTTFILIKWDQADENWAIN